MGLGSVDWIPLGQNYLQEGKAEVFPAALCCWAQPCLCHRSVTVQVLQGLGWGTAEPSGAALWPGCHQQQGLLCGFPL